MFYKTKKYCPVNLTYNTTFFYLFSVCKKYQEKKIFPEFVASQILKKIMEYFDLALEIEENYRGS